MTDEKEKAIEQNEGALSPAAGKRDEISEDDLGKVSGGYKPEKDDGTLDA